MRGDIDGTILNMTWTYTMRHSFFSDYERCWFERHDSTPYGRRAIPLFELAAELVVSRLFAPGTYLGGAASWEDAEDTRDLAHEESELDLEDRFSHDWIENKFGEFVEVPIRGREYHVPGGMSAYRLLFAFGDGSFANDSNRSKWGSSYLPFC